MNLKLNPHLAGHVPAKTMSPEEAAAACMQAQIVIPAMLDKINNTLECLVDAVGVLAMYVEKKGIADGVLSVNDFDKGGTDGSGDQA